MHISTSDGVNRVAHARPQYKPNLASYFVLPHFLNALPYDQSGSVEYVLVVLQGYGAETEGRCVSILASSMDYCLWNFTRTLVLRFIANSSVG